MGSVNAPVDFENCPDNGIVVEAKVYQIDYSVHPIRIVIDSKITGWCFRNFRKGILRWQNLKQL